MSLQLLVPQCSLLLRSLLMEQFNEIIKGNSFFPCFFFVVVAIAAWLFESETMKYSSTLSFVF